MAASRLFLCSLFHHLASFGLAVEASEALAARETYQRVEAGALHTRSLKAAAGAHLRGKSTRGLRSNVFRAAAHAQLRTQQVPLYVPKMGLANVTDPTPFPPPPPVLHPWRDHQPLDTAIGNYLISGFIAQPTVTPPPTQESLDLAFSCPALLTWPGEVSVSAPDPCGSMSTGNWTGADGSEQIKWTTACLDTSSPGLSMPSIGPTTTYTVPGSGDLFGTSQERKSPMGSNTEIRDCGGAVVFTIEEKVYKQAGEPDEEACKKYNSCDGVIYFQYFMKNAKGAVVALTGYTTIFQEAFLLTDTTGAKIAEVSRNGWDPDKRSSDCSEAKPRLWNIKFAGSPPGSWATATNQWPIAAFMSMLSQRDMNRQPNGNVMWSNCETVKSTAFVAAGVLTFACCVCIPMVAFLLCSASILRLVGEAESKFFPKRMGKPSMYGN